MSSTFFLLSEKSTHTQNTSIMSSTSPSLSSSSLSPDTKQLWETFEVTERTKHHFENNIKDRLQHVLASLRYASNLVSCHQRYDLALALVRAAETHISWLWEVEKKESLNQMMVSSSSSTASGVEIDDECLFFFHFFFI